MIGVRQLGWFATGFLAALLAGILLQSVSARAQGMGDGFITRVRPAPVNPPPRRPAEVLPDLTDPAPDVPLPRGPEPDPGDPDADLDRQVSGGRPIVRDGDPTFPAPPEALRDGEAAPGDPPPAQDGVDQNQVDTRDPEDYRAFERPPAGFDPEAFAVEIEPILDRRPRRLFRFEPFEPVGVRMGSFVALPELEMGGVGVNNIFRSSSGRRRDVAIEIRPTLRVVSAWRVHALEFRATGLSSFHNSFQTENDLAHLIEMRGRMDFTRRTSVALLLSRQVDQEARGALDPTSSAGDRTSFTTTKVAAALNHRFNRLAIQLRGAVTDVEYEATSDALGGVQANRDRNSRVTEAALRGTWEFQPTLFAFAEVAANWRAFEAAPASDGIWRDSTGDRWRLGIAFGNKDQRLRGEVSVGYGRQRPEDSRLSETAGLIVDANIGWRMSALTSLLLSARSDFGDSTQAGSGGVLTHGAGIELRHAFRRDLIATAGITHNNQDYSGSDLVERELLTALTLERFFSRELSLFARYQHVDFTSNQAARSYAADEIRLGMRLRR